MRLQRPVVCAAALLALAACNKDNKNQPDVLAQDSSLARDLQLANRDTTAQPKLEDVPTTQPPAVAAPAAKQEAPTPKPAPKPRAPRPVHREVASTPVQHTPPSPPPQPTPVTKHPTVTITPSGNTVTKAAPSTAGNEEGQVGVVAAGTGLSLLAGQRVCTNTNTVGDRITATLANAVTGSNGVVIPAGATAVLEITSLSRSEKAGEGMNIGVVVRTIAYGGKSYPVDGEITYAETEKVRAAGNHDATKVIGGAAVGAILGRILGGKSKTKGTVIGAAGGAAAGAVLANQTADYDACIPNGGRITVKLDSPMHVQATS
jgi:hypothetical protein